MPESEIIVRIENLFKGFRIDETLLVSCHLIDETISVDSLIGKKMFFENIAFGEIIEIHDTHRFENKLILGIYIEPLAEEPYKHGLKYKNVQIK